ncbi:semaphorin-1A-like isoform X3 [Biomphalaria glabrata]|uniref:Semaphorin-1A-like isoform X3 n=1 Tax=Biomphalaria glabrata TaxID=6526 RepID=A0A9W2ZH18_BIOGL|nr:semaphorin-1A-like isoform X3 [Biomphalaria glabrata]
MEYLMVFAFLIVAELTAVTSWQQEWQPNYVSRTPESVTPPPFMGQDDSTENMKLLMVESDTAFVGGRNRLYYLSLKNLSKISTLEWQADDYSKMTCNRKSKVGCENYIRIVVRKSKDKLFVCGTHAFQPRCRHYEFTEQNGFRMQMPKKEDEVGTGMCPFDPNHNSTAIYINGSFYAATVSDPDSRDPLILQKNSESILIRTQPRDSIFLNEPDFVSSYDKDDKVFFFFREMAVENINCGKAVFSRVGRVCKMDKGGAVRTLQNTFTSFFKARINCSIPGEIPFYFDEIQSTSEFGQGNYRPTKDSGDRSDMIYAVFNTPENAIRGSAVCAYKYTDITQVFKRRFKGQESYNYNWLPVSWDNTPSPHPEECHNGSQGAYGYKHLNFIKSHPLMDEAMQPSGGRPMLVFTSINAKLTQIAVDWQVLAADKNYYDVMFVGTDDGRVIKAINKGTKGEIESVVIEDIQVMPHGVPVTSLKIHSDRNDQSQQRLIVMSKERIITIPLQRCNRSNTCSSCVALQDPYCAWNQGLKQCLAAETGVQSIATGTNSNCQPEVEVEPKTQAPEELTTPAKCTCANTKPEDEAEKEILANNQDKNEDAKAGATMTAQAGGAPLEILVTAVIIAILVSLVVGFFIGYKFQSCRKNRDRDVFYESSSLQRGRNRLSSGDNPYFHTDPKNMQPLKQSNIVVNLKNGKANSLAEPKTVMKSNKVYL